LFPESLSYSAPIRIKQTCALDRPRRKRVKSRPHKSKKGLIFRFLAPTTTSRKKNHLAVKQVQEPQIDRAPPEISTTTNPISSGQSALNPGHTKHGREGESLQSERAQSNRTETNRGCERRDWPKEEEVKPEGRGRKPSLTKPTRTFPWRRRGKYPRRSAAQLRGKLAPPWLPRPRLYSGVEARSAQPRATHTARFVPRCLPWHGWCARF
jgi:hypothetical protein